MTISDILEPSMLATLDQRSGVDCDVIVVGELGITARVAVNDGPGGAPRLRARLLRLTPPLGLERDEDRLVDTRTIRAALAALSPYLRKEGESTGITLIEALTRDGVGLRVGAVGTISAPATPGDSDHALRLLDKTGADTHLVQACGTLGCLAVLIPDASGPSTLRHDSITHPLRTFLETRWSEIVDYLTASRVALLDLPACEALIDQYTALAAAVRHRNPAVRIVVHSFAYPGQLSDLLPLLEHTDLAVLHDEEATDLARDHPDAIAALLRSRPGRAIVQIDSRTVEVIRPADTATPATASSTTWLSAPGTVTCRYRWAAAVDPDDDGPGRARLAVVAAVARSASGPSVLNLAIESVTRPQRLHAQTTLAARPR